MEWSSGTSRLPFRKRKVSLAISRQNQKTSGSAARSQPAQRFVRSELSCARSSQRRRRRTTDEVLVVVNTMIRVPWVLFNGSAAGKAPRESRSGLYILGEEWYNRLLESV